MLNIINISYQKAYSSIDNLYNVKCEKYRHKIQNSENIDSK